MKLRTTLFLPCVIAVMGVATGSGVMADDTGPYVGGSLGGSLVDVTSGQISALATDAGFATASTSIDDTDFGWKLYGGYRFGRYFAAEVGYVDLGEASFTTRTTGPSASIDGKAEAIGLNFQGVLVVPYTDKFRLFAEAGGLWWDVDGRVAAVSNGVGVAQSASVDGVDFKFGFGVTYDVTERFGIRAEYEQFTNVGDPSVTGEADIHFLSAGGVFNF